MNRWPAAAVTVALAGIMAVGTVVAPASGLVSPTASEPHQWGSGTELVSSRTDGRKGRGVAGPDSAISGNGRFAVFVFHGRLVPADTNDRADVYVRDRLDDTVELVSRGPDGEPADAGSWQEVDISDDGRFVVFSSRATNLVAGDTNARRDVFLVDRSDGTTTLVSQAGGVPADGGSIEPAVSGDGQVVAYRSRATNLVPDDTNREWDVFVWERTDASTTRVSVGSSGEQSDGTSRWPSLSSQGRFVAFTSNAEQLVADDTNGKTDVFLHDRVTGVTERVSVGSREQQGRGISAQSAVSAKGRYVAFASFAGNLVPRDENRSSDIFVRDRTNGTTQVASVGRGGRGPAGDTYDPGISANGRYVVFDSYAPLTPQPPWIGGDVFVHDRVSGTTRHVSVPATGDSGGGLSPQISADGRHVIWWSSSETLVRGGKDNHRPDVFVRARR